MSGSSHGELSRDEMESRRLLAAVDLMTCGNQSEVARKFGVSRTTASRWMKVLSGSGIGALRKRPAPGRPCFLSAEQITNIRNLTAKKPRECGFERNRWTSELVADLIEAQYSIHYHPDSVGRLIKRYSWCRRVKEPLVSI